ncbi:MAG: hypothetical protein KDA52_14925, partial [Planctomycetaceae bacterium]|nr:hypothetical protein [Planctomycetaceae bacterium]
MTVASLNWFADPYGAYRAPEDQFLHDVRDLVDTRPGRAALASNFRGSTAMIGSSRTELAYDPASPLLPNGPACNLGLSGTHISEIRRLFDIVADNPAIQHVILFLDFHTFASNPQPSSTQRYPLFGADRSQLEDQFD